MRYNKQRFLIACSQVIFAATYVTLVSPMANAASGFSTTVEQKTSGSTNHLLLADDSDRDDDDDKDDELPKKIKTSIFNNISQRENLEASTLRLVKAERITWADSCLGLKQDRNCSRVLVPGWQVVAASEQQMWIYRTDKSGKMVMLDESSTQAVSATIARVQSVSQQISNRTTVEQRSVLQQRSQQNTVVQARSTQVSAVQSVSVNGKKPGFTLTILQPQGSLQEVTARISVKAKRGKAYAKERFIGDYKYRLKSKAKFTKGLKAGDRVAIRLYDLQNRFIGYSEFECLSANTAVSLVLSANPTQYKVVRTVYGVDTNFDGVIEGTTYNYFTQVSGERVTFLNSEREVQVSQFRDASLSQVATTSQYPASFTRGEFALVRQSLNVSNSNLAAALKAAPGSLVPVTEVSEDASSFDVSQLMMDYREVGVASNVQVRFSDVSANHWAKDFIAELAALEILEGFPDGTFRPDEQVTRAQFAAILNQAFERIKVRNAIQFRDVSTAYWAYNAIREAYQMGFINPVTANRFNPTQALSRLEVLISLARGLNYTFSGSSEAILTAYNDAASIRSDVRSAVAALTMRGIVVNYPDVQTLNADKVATRAEVSALIYKALVSTGEVADIASQYAVEPPQKEVVRAQQLKRDQDDDDDDDKVETKKPRRNCNQGIGNGAEGCDPGKSRPRGGSNDES
ncbi:MAG: S-layer homology domain-containing protein [Calothrix sp. C42_A2020_038]|nr:S-layer homology domain-containing protein [Calothrix sp. C42_A2020_038]